LKTVCVLLNEGTLPSWAPDWSLYSHDAGYLFLGTKSMCYYRAAWNTKPRVIFAEDDKSTLTLRGVSFDTVAVVSGSDPYTEIESAVIEDWDVWEAGKELTDVYGDTANQEIAFERALHGGKDGGSGNQAVLLRYLLERRRGNLSAEATADGRKFAKELFAEPKMDGGSWGFVPQILCNGKRIYGARPIQRPPTRHHRNLPRR
jgi:hypothetical protein